MTQPHRRINGGVWSAPAPSQLHHSHAHLTDVVRSQRACLRSNHRPHHRRLGQHLRWSFCDSGISPHLRDALGKRFKGSAVVQHLPQLPLSAGVRVVHLSLNQELGAKGHHDVVQARMTWTVVAEIGHRLVDLDRVAC